MVEAASENPAVKFAVFEQLDRMAAPDAILATNTSSISITEIAARTRRPGQVIGMHFMNPVPVMQLVEVIRGHATSDATTRTVMETAAALGKTPVEVNDYPGFVSNRVLMPMINEAIFCVMEGVATPEAIDTVMKLGMAHPMGPLALADFIGLDVCLAILEVLHKGLGDDKYRAVPAAPARWWPPATWAGRAGGGSTTTDGETSAATVTSRARWTSSPRCTRSGTSRCCCRTIPAAATSASSRSTTPRSGPRSAAPASGSTPPPTRRSPTRCGWRGA